MDQVYPEDATSKCAKVAYSGVIRLVRDQLGATEMNRDCDESMLTETFQNTS